MDEKEKATSRGVQGLLAPPDAAWVVVLRPTTGEMVIYDGRCFFPSRSVARQVVNADLK